MLRAVGSVTEQQALTGQCPAPAGADGIGQEPLWTPPGDVCLQVGHPGGAQHHLCSVMLGCFPEFNQEETPENPKCTITFKNKTTKGKVCRVSQEKGDRTTNTGSLPWILSGGTVIKVLPCPQDRGAHRIFGVNGRGGSEKMPGSHHVLHTQAERAHGQCERLRGSRGGVFCSNKSGDLQVWNYSK